MSFFLDLDDDFEVFDNQESVKLTLAGTSTTVVTCALRRQLSVREAAASGGAYTVRDVNFHIPRSGVCKSPPGVGSLLETESSEIFTILQVDKATLKSRFKCTCREPILQSDLDEDLVIESVTYLRDRMNSPYEQWNSRQNIKGKVYVNANMDEIKLETRRDMKDVSIYLAGSPEIESNWRIRKGTETFLIKQITRPRLGMLTALIATPQYTPAVI